MPTAELETPTTPTDAMSSWIDGITPLMTDTPVETPAKKEETKDVGKTLDGAATAGAGGKGAVAPGGKTGAAEGLPASETDTGAKVEDDKPPTETRVEEDKWPRTAKDWEKFRATRKESEAKLQSEIAQRDQALKDIQARYTALQEQSSKRPEENPQTKAELDRLKKDNEDMSRRLQVLDVTQHPKFQSYFKNKVAAQVTLAQRIVGEELAKDIEAALALPDSPEFKELKEQRMASVIEGLSPLQQSRIGSVLNSLAQIETEREEEIALAKENSARARALDQETADSTKRQLTKTTETALNEAVQRLQDKEKGSPLFQLRDGDEKWNTGVKTRIELARNLFYGTDKLGLNDYVNAALSAASYPEVLSSYKNYVKTSKEEIAKLTKQVEALSAAQPRRGDSVDTGGDAEAGKTRLDKTMSPMEVTAAWLKSGPWSE